MAQFVGRAEKPAAAGNPEREAILAWMDDSGTNKSSSSITVSATGSGSAGAGKTGIAFLSNSGGVTKWVISYRNSSAYPCARIISYDGTTFTVGTEYVIESVSRDMWGCFYHPDGDKIIVMYHTHIHVLSFSGTTISAGAGSKTAINTSKSNFCGVTLDRATGDICVWATQTSNWAGCVITFSGATPTVGSFSGTLTSQQDEVYKLAKISSTKVVMMGGDNNATNERIKVTIATISGTTVSAGHSASDQFTAVAFANDTGGGGVCAWTDDNGNEYCSVSLEADTGTQDNNLSVCYEDGASAVAQVNSPSTQSAVIWGYSGQSFGTMIDHVMYNIGDRMAMYWGLGGTGVAFAVPIYLGNNGKLVRSMAGLELANTPITEGGCCAAANDDYSFILVCHQNSTTMNLEAFKQDAA